MKESDWRRETMRDLEAEIERLECGARISEFCIADDQAEIERLRAALEKDPTRAMQTAARSYWIKLLVRIL